MKNKIRAGRPSQNKQSNNLSDLISNQSFKRINFDLNLEDYKKLRIYVAKNNLTIRELLTNFIRKLE